MMTETRLQDFLLEAKLPPDAAEDFQDLLNFCTKGAKLSVDTEEKLREKEILIEDNKINISEYSSGVEWIMLALYYVDIIPCFPDEQYMESARKNYPGIGKISVI